MISIKDAIRKILSVVAPDDYRLLMNSVQFESDVQGMKHARYAEEQARVELLDALNAERERSQILLDEIQSLSGMVTMLESRIEALGGL